MAFGSSANNGMPELPGMWYDAASNRYYKVTSDNPRPQAAPSSTESKSPCHSRNYSVHKLLKSAEQGSNVQTTISATMLASARRKPALETYSSAVNVKVFPGSGSTALVSPTGTVDLRHFPSGGCIDSLHVPEQILAITWNDNSRVVGLALRDPWAFHDRIQLAEFPKQGPARNWLGNFVIQGHAHSLALSQNMDPVVAGSRVTEVFSLSDQIRRSIRLRHKDKSAGLVTLYPRANDILTGTRAGNIYRWDLRIHSRRPVATIQPNKPSCSIADMCASACNNRLYVSTMLDEPPNLMAWDHRMISLKKPVVTFMGHKNSFKRLRFDVDETGSGGLLAAGGDDGRLRFWDSKAGGEPLAMIDFGNEVPLGVKLVCWSGNSKYNPARPGAWVVTDKQPYTVEVGSLSGQYPIHPLDHKD